MGLSDTYTTRIKLLFHIMIEYLSHRGLGKIFLYASLEHLVYLYFMSTVNYTASHVFRFPLTGRKGVTNLWSPFTMCIGFYGINVVNLSPGTHVFIAFSFSLLQLSSQVKTYFIFFYSMCLFMRCPKLFLEQGKIDSCVLFVGLFNN